MHPELFFDGYLFLENRDFGLETVDTVLHGLEGLLAVTGQDDHEDDVLAVLDPAGPVVHLDGVYPVSVGQFRLDRRHPLLGDSLVLLEGQRLGELVSGVLLRSHAAGERRDGARVLGVGVALDPPDERLQGLEGFGRLDSFERRLHGELAEIFSRENDVLGVDIADCNVWDPGFGEADEQCVLVVPGEPRERFGRRERRPARLPAVVPQNVCGPVGASVTGTDDTDGATLGERFTKGLQDGVGVDIRPGRDTQYLHIPLDGRDRFVRVASGYEGRLWTSPAAMEDGFYLSPGAYRVALDMVASGVQYTASPAASGAHSIPILKPETGLPRDTMRVVVSIGGSVLAPDLSEDRVRRHAAAIERLLDAGVSVGIVVGGGAVAREYIQAARALGANEIALDDIGIAVTRLNARLLIAALEDVAAPTPIENYEEGLEAMRRGDVPVLGGVTPGQTTDAVSAALAEYVEADLLVYATSVPGVFSADPETDDSAEHFERMSAGELVDVIVDTELVAGSSAPVDLLAAKLIERSRMRTIVLDGTDPDRIVDAVLHGDHDGTDVIPAETQGNPSRWTQG